MKTAQNKGLQLKEAFALLYFGLGLVLASFLIKIRVAWWLVAICGIICILGAYFINNYADKLGAIKMLKER